MLTKTIKLYENREDVTLTTYVLADSGEMLAGKARPAVLICPGGAYLSCSDREAEPVALRFASMGYHAFVLRYSVYFEGQNGWGSFGQTEAKEHCIFPRPMQDIGKAMLTIREHAQEWLVDTDKIAVCGFSAGAHNCAMYGVYWDSAYMTEHFGRPAEEFRPAAMILGYTLSDYLFMQGSAAGDEDPMAKEMFEMSVLAYLGTRQPEGEILDTVSPARHVGKQTPPTFLWATASDELVPVEHTYRMASALARAGIPHEVHIFENGPHGLSLADQSSAGDMTQVNGDAAWWVYHVQGFLKRRMAISLPEKPAWMEELGREFDGTAHKE